MTGAAILTRPSGNGSIRGLLRWLAAAIFALGLTQVPAAAQDQLVLESDHLVYDYDANVISAVGNVVVHYRGYVLTADRLTYYQTTGRLVAIGGANCPQDPDDCVNVVDTGGTAYRAAQMDVTDDFREGFIQQLYVATADRTFFTAETAERSGGRITQFFNSTYTACEARPNERPPLWNVRAAKIIHDEEERMVYFERPRLEFLGVPVAFLPFLATPDPTVERATGFLFPNFSMSNTTGFGVGIPFFWALAPNYDLTITPTYHTNAGFLGEAEWRHRTFHGMYTIQAAAIYETKPGPAVFRGGVATTGDYHLNRFWSFGWDGAWQTDRGFSNTYQVLRPSGSFITSEVHLVGLKDQLFVQAYSYHFRDVRPLSPRTDQARQALVRPVLDHEYILDAPVFGGEVRVVGNLTSLSRGANDPFMVGGTTYYYGLEGNYTRISEEVSWRRDIIGPLGQVFTPFAFARGDIYFLDLTAPPAGITPEAIAGRAMVGVGLQWAWPFLITMGQSRHVIEPIVQLIARPSEAMIGALPNEDAQSLFFDVTNLLAWDRFSGWDRVEGGTRLTLALRYSGQFNRGSIQAVVGQSFQLTGSVAMADIRDTGVGTGLEANRSDLVAAFSAAGLHGNSIALSGRFDGATYALQRGSIAANTKIGPFSASAGVAFDRSRLDLEGDPATALMATSRASLALGPNWTLSGGFGYDFTTGVVINDFVGLTYECECAAMSITFSETRSPTTLVVNRTILFSLQLRTLGDFDIARRN